MNNYTIYCTEGQVKKAFELGAPIEILPNYIEYRMLPFVKCTDGNERPCVLPTAEQMLGWLEEQKIFIFIAPCFDINCSWHISSKGYNKYGYTSDINICKTRKEATIAAIDAALDYLSKKVSNNTK